MFGCEGLFNVSFCENIRKVFNNECFDLNCVYAPYEAPPSKESRISNLKIIIKYEEETRTNKQKIEGKGFDYKESFRNIK